MMMKYIGKGVLFISRKKNLGKKDKRKESSSRDVENKKFGPCFHCKKDGHAAKFSLYRSNLHVDLVNNLVM